MKWLVYLLIIGAGGFVVYDFASKNTELKSQVETWVKNINPPKDSQGRLLVDCSRCQGTGTIKCTAPKCKNGKVECPGQCMKLSVGRWTKLKVAGHDPEELWQTFQDKNGGHSWSQAHVGEVVEIQNGAAVNLGKCKICEGTTKVNCKVCGGTGEVTCPVCKGEKQVADKTTSAPPPKSGSPAVSSARPLPTAAPVKAENIRLKDGRTLTGVIVMRDETSAWIRTEDGKKIQVPISNLVKP